MGQTWTLPPPPPLNARELRDLRDKLEARCTGPDAPYKQLEDEWNANQDRVSYFWQVVAAIVIALLVFLSLR